MFVDLFYGIKFWILFNLIEIIILLCNQINPDKVWN